MGFFKQVGKLFAYNDGSIDRVQMGELAAYTDSYGLVSPAHPGIRCLDSGGQVVFDSMGLTNVMKQLAISGAVGSQNFSSTTKAEITGTQIPFSVSRQTDLLIQGFVTGKVTAGAGNGQFHIEVLDDTGTPVTSNGDVWCGVTSFLTLSSYLRVTIPAGAYRAHFVAGVDAGGTTYNVPGNSTVLEVIALSR